MTGGKERQARPRQPSDASLVEGEAAAERSVEGEAEMIAEGPRSPAIWVDADACPRPVREILVRASERVGVAVTLVANQAVPVRRSALVQSVQVPTGIDAADSHIAREVAAGDLVITADIPLAAEVVARGATALSPRGERYTDENIRERLRMRDFMDLLRGTGVDTGGPAPFGPGERARFAKALDSWLARRSARRPA